MDTRGERLVMQPGQDQLYVPIKDTRTGSRRQCPPVVRVRFLFAILGFCMLAIIYGLKVNLSVAMVGMINHTAVSHDNASIKYSDCKGDSAGNKKAVKDGELEWNESIKGLLLASYFIGYLVSQVPGGRVAEVLSAKWIIFAAVLLNIIPTALAPMGSKIHWAALLVLRIIQGVGGGFSFPASHVMISRWSPFPERSIMSSVTYAGTAIGTVLSMLLTGIIVSEVNWEASFYIMASLSAIWCFFWIFFVSDTPRTNRWMSEKEKDYIYETVEEEHGKEPKVPWKEVWTSIPFLAILFSHLLSNFGWYTLLIETPIYYDQVLRLNMTKITIASSIPFFTLWVFSLGLSSLQSALIKRNKITVTFARKLATFIASAIPAVCLLGVTFCSCNEIAIFILIGTGITLMGGMFSGFLSNHIDIAPHYAGTLMGITNTVGTIPGIIVPIIIGELTEKERTRQRWNLVFYFSAACLALEAVVYTIFGSGEPQPWGSPGEPGAAAGAGATEPGQATDAPEEETDA